MKKEKPPGYIEIDWDDVNQQIRDLLVPLALDKIKKMTVEKYTSTYSVKAKDLKELLYFWPDDSSVEIGNELLYMFFCAGIKINGFRPSKSRLRQHYKLSMDEINKLMPGSYPRGWSTRGGK